MSSRDALLSVAGVTKRFGSGVVVGPVSFEVAGGERFCLLGHNGAGKTTVLRLIAGLLYPDEGSVFVAGKDPAREAAIRRRMGYVSGEPYLYDKLTVEEHLRMHAALYGLTSEEAKDRGWVLMEDLGLDPTRRVESLSFGTRKKLALLLALVHAPDLLVLDEPLNGLDPGSARTAERLLTEHAARAGAVVLSTHSHDFAASFANKIGVMREGRLASLGTRKEAGSR